MAMSELEEIHLGEFFAPFSNLSMVRDIDGPADDVVASKTRQIENLGWVNIQLAAEDNTLIKEGNPHAVLSLGLPVSKSGILYFERPLVYPRAVFRSNLAEKFQNSIYSECQIDQYLFRSPSYMWDDDELTFIEFKPTDQPSFEPDSISFYPSDELLEKILFIFSLTK